MAAAAGFAVSRPAAEAEAGLFSSYDVLRFRIEAPFDDLFAGAKKQPDYAVDGKLAAGAGSKTIPIRVSLRGHTSRRDSECSFPKLKLESTRDEPLLGGAKTLKIGTHCGESTEDALTARFGRLPNERSPWREAAVYRLLDALRIPALRARAARITYVFGDRRAGAEDTGGRTVERNAMLLEDDDDAIARVGGTDEIEAGEFTTAKEMFSREDAANLALAQALIGNFDWCIKFTADDTYRCDARLKLWNVIAARTANGRAKPIMYDFDVSGMVAGSHRWFANVFNREFLPSSQSERGVEVVAQVQRTRTLFTRAELDAARRRFLDRRRDAYRALDDADVDADGRRHMREYADAFFSEIESDDAFYRPVVVKRGVMLRSEPDASAPSLCADRGAVPVGTPVGEPLETRGSMARVVLLDALWHWSSPPRCPEVLKGSVWINRDAVGTNFPQ